MRRAGFVGTRWLGVGLAAALAVFTLSLAVTGRLGLYINPDSTWFAVSMAVFLLIGAVASFALPLGAEADHGHDHGDERVPQTRGVSTSGAGAPFAQRPEPFTPLIERGREQVPTLVERARYERVETPERVPSFVERARYERVETPEQVPSFVERARYERVETPEQVPSFVERARYERVETPERGREHDHERVTQAQRVSTSGAGAPFAQRPETLTPLVERDHDHDHHAPHPLAVAATVVGGVAASGVVVLTLVLPPASLSAELAMSRDVGATPLFGGADTVQLASTGDTASFGVGEWATVFATATNPDAFDGETVELTGFVTPGEGDAFDLTRLVITHCVIDAQPASLPVVSDSGAPDTGQWVSITGTVRSSSDGQLVVDAAAVEEIAEPEDPYEY